MKKFSIFLLIISIFSLLSCSKDKKDNLKEDVKVPIQTVIQSNDENKALYQKDSVTGYVCQIPTQIPQAHIYEGKDRILETFSFTPCLQADIKISENLGEDYYTHTSITYNDTLLYSLKSLGKPTRIENNSENIDYIIFSPRKDMVKKNEYELLFLDYSNGMGNRLKLNSSLLCFDSELSCFIEYLTYQYLNTPLYKIVDAKTFETIKTVVVKEGKNQLLNSHISYLDEEKAFRVMQDSDSYDFIDILIPLDPSNPYIIKDMELYESIWDERLKEGKSYQTNSETILYKDESIWCDKVAILPENTEVVIGKIGTMEILNNKRSNWCFVETQMGSGYIFGGSLE